MKLKNNLLIINILIITLGLALSTVVFLGTMSREVERQAIRQQETAIRALRQLLSAKGSDFRVVDGRLMVGNYVINGNNEIPDQIREIFGGTATLFMGDTRVSTNVLKEDGSRAIGTRLTGRAYDPLFKYNRSFRGETAILGIPYLTAYDPIRDRKGDVVGAMYVGVKKNEVLQDYGHLKRNIIAGTAVVELLLVVLAWGVLRERMGAERSLRHMADRLQLITDSIPAAIAYVDTEFRYRFANRRYSELFQLAESGDLEGKSMRDVLDRAFLKAREDNLRLALAGKEVTFSTEFHRKDGVTLHLQTAYVPHLTADGEVVGHFIQHHDITSLTLAQEALRTSEEQYRTLFNTTGTASFVSEVDTTISLANEGFCRLTGYTAEEIQWKLSWPELVAADSREMMLGYHKTRRIDPGTPPRVYEAAVVSKDGTRHPCTVYVNLIPGTGRSIISFLDITPQKQLETSLQTQLAFLQTLVDTIPNPLFYKDRDGRYTGCNKAFESYLGHSREEVIGKSVFDLAPPEMAGRYDEMDRALFDDPGVQVYDSSVRYADGAFHDVTFYKATFINSEGTVDGLVGVILDVTERRRAELWLEGEKSALEMIVQNAPLVQVMELLCRNFEAQSPGSLCSILLLDKDSRLRHSAAPSLPEEYVLRVNGTRIGPGIGSCGTAAYTKRMVITADIATDPAWEKYRSLPLRFGLRGAFSTPILSSKGSLLGTFAAYYPEPHEPTPMEVQLLEQAAHLASIIIERNQNEAALRESEERFHQIFIQKDDAVLLIRISDMVIMDANPAALELFGYDHGALLAMQPSQLLAKEDFDALLAAIPGDVTEAFQINRAQGILREGGPIMIAIRCKILLLRSEYVIHCSIRDIREKVRLEDEVRNAQAKLIHANKMTSIGMLASSVAHEINNPNNCISVNSAMMTEIWGDAEPLLSLHREEHGEFDLRGIPFSKMREIVPRLLDGITEGSRRISGIVRNMRDYVRDDRGENHLPVDLNQLLQNATSILWHHIHLHTDHFATHLGEGLPPARGNAQQLEQVFINLIANALQALPHKGRGVTVSTGLDASGEALAVRVTDEGGA